MDSVSILLPTLNEEQNIERVIREIRTIVPQVEIVVIDGLSKDKTVELAREAGAKVLIEKRKGKGHAIKTAFENIDSNYAIMIDADLTYPAKDIPLFIEKLKNGNDVVMGSRFKGKIEQGAMSLINEIGNRIISLFASILYIKPVSDVCTGMWGFNKKAYKAIEITAPNFEVESNLYTQTIKKQFRTVEIPINYAKRGGESKVQIIDGIKICMFLFKEKFGF